MYVFIADPDPATGAWRNIHWYAAKPCHGIKRDEACMPLPDDREKFSTHWFSEAEAELKLKLDDEKFSKSYRKTPRFANLKVTLVEASVDRIARHQNTAPHGGLQFQPPRRPC